MLFLRPIDHISVVRLASLCWRLLGGSTSVASAEELATSVAASTDFSRGADPLAQKLFFVRRIWAHKMNAGRGVD